MKGSEKAFYPECHPQPKLGCLENVVTQINRSGFGNEGSFVIAVGLQVVS